MSWIEHVVAPLTELNPIKYLIEQPYRYKYDQLLGKRAKRIFVYQALLATTIFLAAIAFIVFGLMQP